MMESDNDFARQTVRNGRKVVSHLATSLNETQDRNKLRADQHVTAGKSNYGKETLKRSLLPNVLLQCEKASY
jgi:hypothetical protein